jgi:hypothetical protein
VRILIAEQHVWPLEHVAQLTGMPSAEIVEELAQVLHASPESNLTAKYAHFMVYERAHKCLFEGEDRNRAYLWSMTPFYSPDVFDYAMSCGEAKKRRYRLYRELLSHMLPQARHLPNVNWGIPAATPATGLVLAARELFVRLPRWMRVAARGRRGGVAAASGSVHKCLIDQLDGCRRLREELRIDSARALAETASREQAELLLTVVSVVEWLSSGRSTLERYVGVDLQ